MAYARFTPTGVAAENIDAYVQNFVNRTADVENGAFFVKGALSNVRGEREVYETAAYDGGDEIWFADDLKGVFANVAPGFDVPVDTRDAGLYVNTKGSVFAAKKIILGDKFTLSPEGFTNTRADDTYLYAYAAASATKLTWVEDCPTDGAAFKFLRKVAESAPTMGFNSGYAYLFKLERVAIEEVVTGA